MAEVAKNDLKLVSIEDLVAYRMQHDSLIIKKEDYDIETRYGTLGLEHTNKQTNRYILP
jgi:3,4-dihydroxy 2-butanone 4-phosphate synthase/GTP cyclohydrolase II